MKWILLLLICMSCAAQTDIGIIAPQTGPLAFLGEDMVEGVQVATTNIVVEDDQCNPKETVKAMQTLIQQEVKVIVGPFCSGATLAAAPLANEHQIILISPSATSSDITHAGPFVYRVVSADVQEAAFLSTIVQEEKIAIITREDAFGRTMAEHFEQNVAGKIIHKTIMQGNDLRTELLKIKEGEAEAIVFFLYPEEYALLNKQAEELQVDVAWYTVHTFDNEEWYTTITQTTIPKEKNHPFFQEYRKKFGKEATVESALSFDAAMIAQELLHACKEVTCMQERLASHTYNGATGIKAFDEYGDMKHVFFEKRTAPGRI